MSITMPETIAYGKVVGRFIFAVGDNDDVDELPDATPVRGTITFVPAMPLTRETTVSPPTTVVRSAIICTLNNQGLLTAPSGVVGVWLVAGTYKVTYNTSGASIKSHDILVTPLHTDENPLDLTLAQPAGGPVMTPSQYAELASRLMVIEASTFAGDYSELINPPLLGTAAQADVDDFVPQVEFDANDAVFSVTDDSGRRSWLEIAADGSATPRVKELINTWVRAQDLTTPQESGYSFAVTDTTGDIGEIALDEAGKVPQWVLDRWRSRMNVPAPAPAVILPKVELPGTMYTLVGTPHQLIHSHYIANLSKDENVKATNPLNGSTSLTDRWAITPTASGTNPFTFAVYDRAAQAIESKTVSVVSNDATLTTPCRLLPIGDSITQNGSYAATAAALLGGTTQGTRTAGTAFVEGRGGWAFSYYTSKIGQLSWTWDSPFIFPVGVAPTSYRGNTDYWKMVVSGPGASSYETGGFQRAARADFGTTGPFMFDVNGYPVSPVENDVVVDPTLASGSRWRKYVSGSWTTMSPQPSTELNFASYLARNAHAHPQPPTVISIMSVTNDFGGVAINEAAVQSLFTSYSANLDAFIASVRAWSATVPIILCIPPVGGSQATGWTASGTHEFEYRARVKLVSRSFVAKYDTPAQRTNKVFLASFLGCADDSHMSGGVHPDTLGHTSMGAWLAGTIAHALN